MLVYKQGEFTIVLNKYHDKLNISNSKEWISITDSIFILLLKLIELNNDFDRVVFNKISYKIEILNVGGNFALTYASSRNVVTNVVLRAEVCTGILSNSGNILNRIHNIREKKLLTHGVSPMEFREAVFNHNKTEEGTPNKKRKLVEDVVTEPYGEDE